MYIHSRIKSKEHSWGNSCDQIVFFLQFQSVPVSACLRHNMWMFANVLALWISFPA
jgi:hypothetical protein